MNVTYGISVLTIPKYPMQCGSVCTCEKNVSYKTLLAKISMQRIKRDIIIRIKRDIIIRAS